MHLCVGVSFLCNAAKVTYRAVLGGLRREGRWEAAVKLLSDMAMRGVGADEQSIAMGMSACVVARQPERALDLFTDMRDVDRVSN